MTDITELDIAALRKAFDPLIGLRVTWLSIPGGALLGFEPSQIAVIVNTLLDGILPQIQLLTADDENADDYQAGADHLFERDGFVQQPPAKTDGQDRPDHADQRGPAGAEMADGR